MNEATAAIGARTGEWVAVGRQVENTDDDQPDICSTAFDGIEWPDGDAEAAALAAYIAACNPDAIRELLIRLDEARQQKGRKA